MTSQERTTLFAAVGIVGGLFLLIVAVVVGAAVLSRSPDTDTVYARDEFKRIVLGKTPEQVIAAIGRPDVQGGAEGDGPEWWHYHERVRNPVTGKANGVTLKFVGGRVTEVEWSNL